MHESEGKAERPAVAQRRLRASAPERPEVLDPDEHDARGDQRLDRAGGRRHDLQRREGKRDGVGDGERRNDLHQLPDAAAEEQQADEERDVIVPGEDVLDPEQEKAPERARGRPRPARLERGLVPLRHALRYLVRRKVDARQMRMSGWKELEESGPDR